MKIKENTQTFHFPPSPHSDDPENKLYMSPSLFYSTVNKVDNRPGPCYFSSWLLLLYIYPKQMPRLAAPSWIGSELCLNPKQAHMLPKPGLQWKTEGCPFGRHINHLWLGKQFILCPILLESHLLWKISSFHIDTLNRGQLLQKDQVVPTSLPHRRWPPMQ